MKKQSILILWVVILGLFVVTFTTLQRGTDTKKEKDVGIGEFIAMVQRGEMEEVLIAGSDVTGTAKDKTIIRSHSVNSSQKLVEVLNEKHVPYSETDPSSSNQWLMLALKFGMPFLLLIFLFKFMNKAATGQMNRIDGHAASKATMQKKEEIKTTFADVAGIDEAVDEVRELVSFLKDPKKISGLGGRTPKGTLLVGPSGTGKTLLARAVAGEAGVPFFSASAAGFVEMFVGVGAARVRDLFGKAKKQAPCIIFIDELDAVGRKRGGVSFGGGSDEREQTLNELLVQMDGFASNEGVIIMAATNRPDVLDSALTRAGRFDRQVVVPKPDVKGREAILKVHARKLIMGPDIDLSVVARSTFGMTGADLEEMLNEAALHASRAGKKAIDMASIENAMDKVLMGAERKSAVVPAKTKRVVAYHEAGHTVVGWFTPECDPVRKVSIVPRGMAGGVTLFLPQEDKTLQSRGDLLAFIKSLLGGRVAEELKIGDVSTGASNDLERVTDVARRMICDFAMGEGLGMRTYGAKNRASFLDYGYGDKDFSEDAAKRIDAEIDRLTAECYEAVKQLLTERGDLLENLAQELLKRENLDEKDLLVILGPRPTA